MKSADPGILPQSLCFSFTPPEIAKQMLVYPTWCGHYYCTSNYFMRRKTYPPLLAVFVKKGVFHVEYHGEQRKAKRGDVLLLDCADPHYYQATDGLEFLYMHFDGSNSHEICKYIIETQGWLIQRSSNMMVSRLLEDMVTFYESGGVETPFDSSMRIYRLLEMLMVPTLEERKPGGPIHDAIQYIHANIDKQITLNELAKIAILNPITFLTLSNVRPGFRLWSMSPMPVLTGPRYCLSAPRNLWQRLLMRWAILPGEA